MNKAELIEQLEKIPGNPIVYAQTQTLVWKEVLSIISTGINKDGITFSTSDPKKFSFLGPVP